MESLSKGAQFEMLECYNLDPRSYCIPADCDAITLQDFHRRIMHLSSFICGVCQTPTVDHFYAAAAHCVCCKVCKLDRVLCGMLSNLVSSAAALEISL